MLVSVTGYRVKLTKYVSLNSPLKLTRTGSNVEWLTTNFCPGGPRIKGGIRPGPPRIPLGRPRRMIIYKLQYNKNKNAINKVKIKQHQLHEVLILELT